MPSAKQKAAQNKLKAKTAEAKKIQKANPGLKWTTCIKRAWGK